jgi:hypothetical protein
MAGPESTSFADLQWNLPLFDDLFLSMQGQNVMLVDFYLRDLERDLLRELVEIERTPFPATLIVSALSQMWIFVVYELLPTALPRLGGLHVSSLDGRPLCVMRLGGFLNSTVWM